jgi:hypothetical protein
VNSWIEEFDLKGAVFDWTLLPDFVVQGKHRTLEHAEREHILATLKDRKWVLSGPKGAATHLGLNRSTPQFRMKKLGIPGRRDVLETRNACRQAMSAAAVPVGWQLPNC